MKVMYAGFTLGFSVIKSSKSLILNSKDIKSEMIKTIADELYFHTLLLKDAFLLLSKENFDENRTALSFVVQDCLYCLVKLGDYYPGNCDINILYALLICLEKRINQLPENIEMILDSILLKVEILHKSI